MVLLGSMSNVSKRPYVKVVQCLTLTTFYTFLLYLESENKVSRRKGITKNVKTLFKEHILKRCMLKLN